MVLKFSWTKQINKEELPERISVRFVSTIEQDFLVDRRCRTEEDRHQTKKSVLIDFQRDCSSLGYVAAEQLDLGRIDGPIEIFDDRFFIEHLISIEFQDFLRPENDRRFFLEFQWRMLIRELQSDL